MSLTPSIVWFRGKDLRVRDHEPLTHAVAEAAKSGAPVLPVFVLDPFFFSKPAAAEMPHRMQYLLESLTALSKNVEHLGSRLLLFQGKAIDVIPAIAKKFGARRVLAHRWTEPFGRKRDAIVKSRLSALNVALELFEGELLQAPGSVRTQQGTTFAVFTPFSKAFQRDFALGSLLPPPKALPPVPESIQGDASLPTLSDLGLSRNPHLLEGGEKAAHKRLDHFLETALSDYDTGRDRMDLPKTSRLSADLKFGVLSIRTVWSKVSKAPTSKSQQRYLSELLWREFAYNILWERPTVLSAPFRDDFRNFPYEENPTGWTAWAEGRTGYPVVDASARELLHDGFVHNRARMISASFLTKHLLIDYKRGEAHYLKYLTDGDWAQNNMGWQWSAGSGCDAQPYFRVFNPVSQGERFDPNGNYVRKWIPELAKLPAKYIHSPWLAPPIELRAAGVVLGETYPFPVIDLALGRDRFLERAKAHRAPSTDAKVR